MPVKNEPNPVPAGGQTTQGPLLPRDPDERAELPAEPDAAPAPPDPLLPREPPEPEPPRLPPAEEFVPPPVPLLALPVLPLAFEPVLLKPLPIAAAVPEAVAAPVFCDPGNVGNRAAPPAAG